jgi:hypothetical protein
LAVPSLEMMRLDGGGGKGHHLRHADSTIRRRSRGAQDPLFSLKQQCCPHCGAAETLNRHSWLYGNDPTQAKADKVRGQRVLCSDRGERGGCGRTVAIFLDDVLPRHTASASLLWSLLLGLLSSQSIRSAFHRAKSPMALESIYHLLARLRLRLDAVRICLCGRQRPPDCSHSDPLLQTIEHLKATFTAEVCPVRQFQRVFQQSLLG